MMPFSYLRVSENARAVAKGSAKGAKFVAGGTNLLDLMKLNIEQPETLIDINSLPLTKVEVLANNHLFVGSLVKNTILAYHPDVQKRFPVLSQAILSGASAQLRNMASTGGNLLQRTRCYYFYDPAFPCNKRIPGSGCSAIGGYNRNHAVLGTSPHCIATHPSDMCVALTILDALVHIQGTTGIRVVPFAEFHRLPGTTPHIETVLQPGELITGVEIPHAAFLINSAYLKIRDRASYEFALASAAVAIEIQNGTVQQVRIALGGVGTKPWRAEEAEQSLKGKKAGADEFRAAAELALQNAKPSRYNKFKIELAKRTLVRVLTNLTESA